MGPGFRRDTELVKTAPGVGPGFRRDADLVKTAPGLVAQFVSGFFSGCRAAPASARLVVAMNSASLSR